MCARKIWRASEALRARARLIGIGHANLRDLFLGELEKVLCNKHSAK